MFANQFIRLEVHNLMQILCENKYCFLFLLTVRKKIISMGIFEAVVCLKRCRGYNYAFMLLPIILKSRLIIWRMENSV